jgi:hypothetical protein
MPTDYGAVDGMNPGTSRKSDHRAPGHRFLALALAVAALVACAAVVGLGARGEETEALLGSAHRGQQHRHLVAVLQPQGPIGGEYARKSRRTLALEAYLNTVCAPLPRLSPR